MKIHDITVLMVAELKKANKKFPRFNSRHEGYAVILEEVDELWDEIKKKHPDKQRMLEEAIQVGAMAMKFVQLLEGIEDEWKKPTPETEAKCRACRYAVMTGSELQALGGEDPCESCRNLSNWKPKKSDDYEICPECGSRLVHIDGCVSCPNCGWSACR